MITVETKPIYNGTKHYDTEKTIKIFGITIVRKKVYFPTGHALIDADWRYMATV